MTPPRIARRLLSVLAPDNVRQAFLDDLDEVFAATAEKRGDSAARRWYWMQALRSVRTLITMRRRARRGEWSAPSSTFSGAVLVLRQARRRLLATPGLTTSAIATLSLAFAAWCAVFVLVFGVLLRPLPYADASRLVDVGFRTPGIGAPRAGQSQGGWFLFKRESRSFDAIGIYNMNSVSLTDAGKDPEQVDISMASPEVFDVLGVRPLLGQGLVADTKGQPLGIVLSHGLWKRRYGGDPAVVGSTIEMNGVARIVRGVMPQGFSFPNASTDIWMRDGFDSREQRFGEMVYGSVARLRSGVTTAQAEAELNTFVPQLPQLYSDARPSWIAETKLSARVDALKGAMVGSAGPALWLILASASLVLLLAAANVANLFVIRAERRRKEIGICRAIGASGAQILQIFLVEAAAVSFIAAVIAHRAAALLLLWLTNNFDGVLPRVESVDIGAAGTAGLAAIASIAAIVLGTAGFLTARRGSLADHARGASASAAQVRTRSALTAAQVALAFTLLCGSALLLRSFVNLARVPLGFDASGAFTFRVTLPYRGYETFEKSAAFHHSLEERLRALPGTTAAGAAMTIPLAHSAISPFLESQVFIERRSDAPLEASNVNWRMATSGYFAAMKIPLRSGRWFASTDHFDDTFPLVVSESFARRYLGEQPLGRRIRHFADKHFWTVVGVVGDVRDDGLRDGMTESVYVPLLDQTRGAPYNAGTMTFVVRHARAAAIAADVRSVLRSIDPKLPMTESQTLDGLLARAQSKDRLVLAIVAAFALLAVLVGLIGLYGSLTYMITQRRRELGVRMALGASSSHLKRGISKDAAAIVGAGIAAGAVLAWMMSGALSALLYELSARDAATWLGAVAVLASIAAVSVWLSLRKLTQISPLEALQND